MNRTLFLLLAAVVAIGFQSMLASTASAHDVNVTASGSCVNNVATISFTANETHFAFSNPSIGIFFNDTSGIGAAVVTGAFNSTDGFKFSGQAPAPPFTTSVTVTAIALAPWTDGFPGGQSHTVSVDISALKCAPPATGRFTGGGKDIQSGVVTVTQGLTLHCDLLLSNNFEINWKDAAGTHQFHLLEHTFASCTENPNIIQAPPAAPLDTMVGKGIGRFDNVVGYTIEFTLVDAGEPGTSDTIKIKIYETDNPTNVVLDLPTTFLAGGNLQAHFDQPHK
jgi:hypothetical protein